MAVAIDAWTVAFVLMAAFAAYHSFFKPWRRDGKLSSDGLMLIAFLSMWSQDPWINYSRQYFTYNQHLLNLGCWQCFFPGYQSHASFIGEGLWAGLDYVSIAWLAILGGCWVMHWMQKRWPRIGRWGVIGTILVVAIVFDFLTEILWILPGIYTYVGAAGGPGPVLWEGHYYQFPLFELFLAGLWYTAFSALRFYRDDKGNTVFERGTESLRGSSKQRQGIRVLALIGGCNILFFAVYNFPVDWVASHWATTPRDVYTRSYFVGENCGPETQYACPDPRLPSTNGPNNLYVTPEGKVVAPKGLPVQRGN
jgi:hypothetical protein